MSVGDIRKCGFCQKEYVATKGHSCLQVCGSCEGRHLSSKKKKLSIDKKMALEKDLLARRKLHKNGFSKPLPDVKVSLNWLAPKITEKTK